MKYLINDNPTYSRLPITEFQGNPLVEALVPPPQNKEDALTRLQLKPTFNESERGLAPCYRALLPARLMNFMFPTDQHVQLLQRIYGQILSGYRWRNPLTVIGQQILHGENIHALVDSDVGGMLDPSRNREPIVQVPATISFLTGLSGMGKSTLIRAIMRTMGRRVIKHSKYNGAPFTETQIIYMMRNVPDQCSAKTVCKSFGDQADELMGCDLYAKLFSDKSMTRTHYVAALRKIVANHHVGALIIDEAQNISLAKSGGKQEFLALILNLREELGIPIILVGTYRAAAILKDEASIARRLVEGGFHELRRPIDSADKSWRALCNIIWRYQWVQEPQPISDDVISVLYKCSQGITGIMINLFVTAQTHAIESGIETITPEFIEQIYMENFQPLHPIIEVLSSNDPDLLAKYDDLYFDAYEKLKVDPTQYRIEKIRQEMERKRQELISSSESSSTSKQTAKAITRLKGKNGRSSGDLHDMVRATSMNSQVFDA